MLRGVARRRAARTADLIAFIITLKLEGYGELV